MAQSVEDIETQEKPSDKISMVTRSKPGRKKKTKEDDKCLVCGSKSIGLNFGVHTCSPCKAFFRRNAVKLGAYDFRCRGDGDCPINGDTRRQCNCCRLAKCFRVGMDRNAILSDDQRQKRVRLIEYNRRKRVETGPDATEPFEFITQLLIRPTRSLSYSHDSLSHLTCDDYASLTNVYKSYEQACIPFTYREHVNMPVNESLTLQKFMNASAKIYIGLISYFKLIPEFNSLPVDIKVSLIKSNLNQLVRIHSTYLMETVTPDLGRDSPVFLHIFPKSLYADIRATGIALFPFVHDPILIKLFITVLILSTYMNVNYDKNAVETNDENFTRQVLNVQNVYIELLWRYICSRCSNYQQSALLLSSFVTRTLHSQTVEVKIDEFMQGALPNQNHELEPIIQSMWFKKKND